MSAPILSGPRLLRVICAAEGKHAPLIEAEPLRWVRWPTAPVPLGTGTACRDAWPFDHRTQQELAATL